MDKIILKKPDIALLKKEGYMCFDMHVHSEYSSDCDSKIKDIIKRAEELGIGIAITDHNEIAGNLEAYKLNKNIVIPGTEVRSKGGLDILFYFFRIEDLIDFYKKFVEPNKKISATKLSAIELIKKSSNYKAVSCIAHPYRPSLKRMIIFLINKEKIKSVFNKVKAFEVINSKNFRVFNNMAIRTAIKKNKCIIGGSDSHIIKTIGSVVTCLKKRKEKKTHILDGILSEDAMVIGKERNLIFATIEALFIFIKKNILK